MQRTDDNKEIERPKIFFIVYIFWLRDFIEFS